MKTNLELWDKVEKTNPNYTKKANVKGNNITSIAPQYQIKQATEQFGSYGSAWGFKKVDLDFSLKDLGMASFKATFYYPGGEFEIINSVQLFKDNAKTKIDDDFAKKVETDTLTKALSKLGFNADIFLGKFEDVKYMEELNEEFNPKPEPVKPAPQFTPEQIADAKLKLNACKDLDKLKEVYIGIGEIAKNPEVVFKKDEMKTLLTK